MMQPGSVATHLEALLCRVPVTAGELLAKAEPPVVQALLQRVGHSRGSVWPQATQNRLLFTAAPGAPNTRQGSSNAVSSIHGERSSSIQHWRSYSFASRQPAEEQAEPSVQQQQQQQQPPPEKARLVRLWQLPGDRTELEKSILMCPNLKALAGVVAKSQLAGAAVVLALNRLKRLNADTMKHFQLLQQQQHQHQHQQQEQEQGWQQLQEQLQQHRQQVDDVLQRLTSRLAEVHSQLSPLSVVQALHCFSQLGLPQGNTELLAALLQQLRGNLATLQANHLPVLASAIAAFNASNLDAQQLSDPYADSSMADDQETDTSRSCGAAAQHQQDQEAAAQQQQRPEAASQAAEAARQVLMELCEALQRLDAAAIDAPGVTRCMSAMARLRHYDWLTMRHMSQLAAAHAQSMTPAHLASVLVSCAYLRHYDQELCGVLAEAAEARMPAAKGHQVAMITWALAHLKHDMPGVFAAAAQQAVACVHELEPRHVSNLAWSFAVRKAYSPALYDALAARIAELGVGALEPHHCSIVAWSFAKQGHKIESLMDSLGAYAAGVVDKLLPQNISNLAWAYGRLSHPHPQLFAALVSAAKACSLDGFNHQNLTDLAWGCAATNYQDPELFDMLARATMSGMQELSPHSLSDLTWAFAASRQPNAPTVLGAAAAPAAACLERFSLGMLADLMWSYAAVGVRDDELLAAAAKVLPLRSLSLEQDTEAQAKVLWCLKTLQYRDEALEAQLAEFIPNVKELLDE